MEVRPRLKCTSCGRRMRTVVRLPFGLGDSVQPGFDGLYPADCMSGDPDDDWCAGCVEEFVQESQAYHAARRIDE